MVRGKLTALMMFVAVSGWAVERSEVIVKAFPASDGKTVLIDAGPLDLFVRSADIREIRLTVHLAATAFKESQCVAWLEAHRPDIQDAPDTLHVVAPEPRGISLLHGVITSRARIELVVPPFVRPDLTTSSGSLLVEGDFTEATPLRLRTATGDVEFTGWAPQVEMRSTSGDMRVRAPRAVDSLLARTAGGEVILTGGARRVRCDTSSGNVRLDGLLGPVGIVTTSGNVTCRFDALAATDEIRVMSSSGKVRLTLPPGATPTGEIASARGEIRSVYAGEPDPKGGRLRLAGSGPRVSVTTSSGRIELF
ncbi:MAG: hypothetical protein HXY19_00490 [Thermoanaerobaculaceae bacterium]|nr:hypothetical protein [Thermoanaerobaculaceae bacterium]